MLPNSPTSAPAGAPNPNALRILIVEDEPDIARLISVILMPMKLDLRLAVTGPQALEAFTQIQPHLILLDVMLPEMDGREVCARIRATSSVPIIMMTALDSESDELAGLKSGADDYISKPFNPKVLAARVAAQLRRVYKYDAQPTREETEAERRQRDIEATLGIAPVSSAKTERQLPPGWASCENCSYMGPRSKFEKENALGRRSVACPVCKSTDSITFSLG